MTVAKLFLWMLAGVLSVGAAMFGAFHSMSLFVGGCVGAWVTIFMLGTGLWLERP